MSTTLLPPFHTAASLSNALRRFWLATLTLLAVTLWAQSSVHAQILPAKLLDKNQQALPAAPAARTGPLPAAVQRALVLAKVDLLENSFPVNAVRVIGAANDARMAWYLYDLLHFARESQLPELVDAFEKITRVKLPKDPYTAMGDYLLAWNLPGTTRLPRDEA